MSESSSANTNGSQGWSAFVEVLSTRPDLIDTLMAQHRPGDAGGCRVCAVPGGCHPELTWPCPLWTLADSARRTRARRRMQP